MGGRQYDINTVQVSDRKDTDGIWSIHLSGVFGGDVGNLQITEVSQLGIWSIRLRVTVGERCVKCSL